MAVQFRVHAKAGLVHAKFWDFVTVDETLNAARACALHPRFNPLFNQIVDFRAVEDFERDYGRLIAMLAELPDHLLRAGTEPLILYLAPTPIGQEMAQVVKRSLDVLQGPVLRVVKTMDEARDILGLPEDAFG